MSAPTKAPTTWKANAFTALAKYFEVLAEKESWEQRIEAAKKEAQRAGVNFRWNDAPEVPSGNTAYVCACGCIVASDYDLDQWRKANPLGVITCPACREKASAAAEADAKLEAAPPSPGIDF